VESDLQFEAVVIGTGFGGGDPFAQSSLLSSNGLLHDAALECILR